MKFKKLNENESNQNGNIKDFENVHTEVTPAEREAMEDVKKADEVLEEVKGELEKKAEEVIEEGPKKESNPVDNMYTDTVKLELEEGYYGDRYYAKAYYDDSYRGLADSINTDDFDELLDWCWENNSFNLIVTDAFNGTSMKLQAFDGYEDDPDEWVDPIYSLSESYKIKMNETLSGRGEGFDDTVWDVVMDRLFEGNNGDKNYVSLLIPSDTITYTTIKNGKPHIVKQRGYPSDWYVLDSLDDSDAYNISVKLDSETQAELARKVAKALKLRYEVREVAGDNYNYLATIYIPEEVGDMPVGEYLAENGLDYANISAGVTRYNKDKKLPPEQRMYQPIEVESFKRSHRRRMKESYDSADVRDISNLIQKTEEYLGILATTMREDDTVAQVLSSNCPFTSEEELSNIILSLHHWKYDFLRDFRHADR